MNRTIVWFRRDLRISDHAPLHRAISRGAVIPVFIFDRALLHHPETGSARVAFMLDCLRSLDEDLRDRGGRLILKFGDPVELLPDLIRETGADGIYAYVDYERIYGRVRDARLNQALVEQGLKIRWFEPSGAASEFMDYRDYRKLWYRDMSADMLSTPLNIPTPEDIASEPIPKLTDLGLVPDGKLIPPAGTSAARDILGQFLNEKLDRYYWQLSYPGAEVTSGLSPHIKFGAVSIRECYQTAQRILKYTSDQRIERSCKQFISRLRWGSGFAQRFRYLPQLELRSLYSIFDQDGWEFDEALYEAWKTGQTGFPIIDAAARCLQATGGWMSLNFRSRALYSSFLSNLMNHDWRYGALHFMRHLIDGDCPIDHYQWAMQAGVTHCLDKSWTRIYNPEQAAVDRCDPEGAFIKKWVPELAKIPAVQLGLPPRVQGYPQPILNYREARARRVQQLEEQRSSFRQQFDILPHLARMPKSVLPFGSDRFESEIQWAQKSSPSLFPAALDLDQLDIERSTWLRSWLVAHVEFKPQKTTSRRKKSQPDPNVIQLSLLE